MLDALRKLLRAERDADLDRGLVAEFDSDRAIVAAARTLRERGYTQLDAFTPRPVEALQELIAPGRSTLPRTARVAGIAGALTGLGVQWYCNAWAYPINVGGRPPFSLAAYVPITFEIMVLFAALATFFGVLFRMRLPRLAHPIFDAPGITSASLDRFWLLVSASDSTFEAERTRALLLELGGARVTFVPEPAAAPSSAPSGAAR